MKQWIWQNRDKEEGCVHVFGGERLKDRDVEVMRLLETILVTDY